MTVKEFLRSVREQDSLLRAYEQELEDLRRRAYNISSPKLGDKIQSNHLATLDEIVDKLDSQIEKVNAAWDELIDKRDQAKALIDKVDDESSRCVLYRYYIDSDMGADSRGYELYNSKDLSAARSSFENFRG